MSIQPGRIFLLFLAVLFLAVQPLARDSHAESSQELTVDEAGEVLKSLDPNLIVLSVERAPVEGLWEVIVEGGGRKSIVYLDSARKKIVIGSILDLATRVNLTKNKFDEINKVDFSAIPLDDALVMGDPSAKHKIIVFDDPD